MPQLDALRFLAVLGVMVAHNWHPRRLPWLVGDLDWAALGVRLFFVLSGFLITGILLDCRTLAAAGSRPVLFYLRQFYARRFLRIFPLYYLVLVAAIVLDVPPARDLWVWFFTFTSNIYVTAHQAWPGRLGHFWTLAVEEQFYLVWPWLVLFAPRKWLVNILLGLILVAPAFRAYGYSLYTFDIGAGDFKAGTFTLASFDSLGIGSLVAVFWRSVDIATVHRVLATRILPAGLFIYLAALALYHYRIQPAVIFVLGDLGVSMIFGWLVSAAAMGFSGTAGRVLQLRPLVYLGKISYGLYVYHFLMPLPLMALSGALGLPYRVPGRTNFLLSTALTVAVASLS